MCVIAVVGVAPCQCRSFGGHQTTSPGRSSTFGWPSPLYPAKAGGDDQNLSERMCMPGRTRARLERHTPAAHTRRIGSLEQRVNAYGAGKVLIWSFAGRL